MIFYFLSLLFTVNLFRHDVFRATDFANFHEILTSYLHELDFLPTIYISCNKDHVCYNGE